MCAAISTPMHKQARQTDRQTDGWRERERENDAAKTHVRQLC